MFRNVFLVVGPSGAGKTSLTNALINGRKNLTRAVTVTTRQPRLGEVDGKDYIFVSPEKFEEMRASGEFFETDNAFGESYGTPCDFDKQQGDLVFIITLAGARAVKEAFPEAKTILILPASVEGARRRVIERQAPNENERISAYEAEYQAAMAYAREIGFDAVIENDHFQDAFRELEGVCRGVGTVPIGRAESCSVRKPRKDGTALLRRRLASESRPGDSIDMRMKEALEAMLWGMLHPFATKYDHRRAAIRRVRKYHPDLYKILREPI